jgi:hypothetical protein
MAFNISNLQSEIYNSFWVLVLKTTQEGFGSKKLDFLIFYPPTQKTTAYGRG